MLIYRDTKYKDFLTALSAFDVTQDQLEICFDRVKHLAVLDELNYDTNLLIFGKLCKLQQIKTGAQMLTKPFGIIHGPIDKDYKSFHRVKRLRDKQKGKQIARRMLCTNTADALRFILKVRDDMNMIVRVFNEIKYKPTPEEKKAGIDKINGSLHNVADWYARRMGIQDVEQVYLLPWTRIYAALKIDVTDINFRRSLSRVIENKNKQ